MYLTGFADEAASDIDGQIRVTKELGWEYIEARAVDGEIIHDISDRKFDEVCGKLHDSGIRVNCFGSTVANWGKRIDQPCDSSIEEAKRAIVRMKRLGTKLIRIMSYAVLDGREPDDQMEEERFKRLRTICSMFLDEGIQPVHENCMNYGGMGWQSTVRLVENVPGLRLVFDTGNPVDTLDRWKPKPYPRQSSWEFYSHVREHISYIHIKDGIFDPAKGESNCTFPGEGDGDVRRILSDLLHRGYDGGISIEPHMTVQYHDASKTSPDQVRYSNYLEYGQRTMRMIEEILADKAV